MILKNRINEWMKLINEINEWNYWTRWLNEMNEQEDWWEDCILLMNVMND